MMKGIGVVTIGIVAALLTACSASAATVIEMEVTGSYDVSDPFVNEKLFYVPEDTDTLELDVSFEMEGERATLEIADNETGQVYWSDTWQGNVESTKFTVPLEALEKEKDYVVRFTGYGIDHAKVLITSRDSLARELEKPRHPER